MFPGLPEENLAPKRKRHPSAARAQALQTKVRPRPPTAVPNPTKTKRFQKSNAASSQTGVRPRPTLRSHITIHLIESQSNPPIPLFIRHGFQLTASRLSRRNKPTRRRQRRDQGRGCPLARSTARSSPAAWAERCCPRLSNSPIGVSAGGVSARRFSSLSSAHSSSWPGSSKVRGRSVMPQFYRGHAGMCLSNVSVYPDAAGRRCPKARYRRCAEPVSPSIINRNTIPKGPSGGGR